MRFYTFFRTAVGLCCGMLMLGLTSCRSDEKAFENPKFKRQALFSSKGCYELLKFFPDVASGDVKVKGFTPFGRVKVEGFGVFGYDKEVSFHDLNKKQKASVLALTWFEDALEEVRYINDTQFYADFKECFNEYIAEEFDYYLFNELNLESEDFRKLGDNLFEAFIEYSTDVAKEKVKFVDAIKSPFFPDGKTSFGSYKSYIVTYEVPIRNGETDTVDGLLRLYSKQKYSEFINESDERIKI